MEGSPASSEGTPQAAASVHAEDMQVAPAPKVRRLAKGPLIASERAHQTCLPAAAALPAAARM